ncbi:conserved hypothetical protein [Talaromyces stipitatus ATCC 10500]|uniref:CCHC-type domain-containing protein n=1 Tax=Talaromyces stipitatus (strain ATCC 10500 / CBS 375.48 / QM 6759 / NRRL 1006) TaxID=441959 RepID=B8MTS2_TALSN|nr:uncharacterized protein TSTA_005870 [Talaromyces stipitatus ATCC 10500]EED12557.1 conserved hypothetical protein [Talaromyces stipitatus ATCC 10500]
MNTFTLNQASSFFLFFFFFILITLIDEARSPIAVVYDARARPTTLDSQGDNGAKQETASEQHGPIESSQASERKEQRLTFDPEDLAQLEGLEVEDLAEDLNLQDFVELAGRDPKMLYKFMADRWDNELNSFKESIDRMKKACERKLETKDDALSLLINERDKLRQTLERMTIRYTSLIDSGTAPSSSKGPKIPDGKKLTNSNKSRYESWKIDVQGKLRALAHQYNTPESRILYVKLMCEGDAADHLMARMRDDSPDPYLDATDMFEHLDTIYLDANREINAKAEFRQLAQKSLRFQTFLSKFNLLAMDAKKSRIKWKEELYHRLNPEMKRAMIREANDSTVMYADFVKECTMVANRLEQIAREEKSAPKDSKDAKDNRDTKSKTSDSGKGVGKALRVNLSDKEFEELKEARLCFNCKQPGHLNRNCPLRKKNTTEIKWVEVLEDKTEPAKDEA